jgi:hypothetical protein
MLGLIDLTRLGHDRNKSFPVTADLTALEGSFNLPFWRGNQTGIRATVCPRCADSRLVQRLA